eukprot:Selendium_serpulae@DN4711_c0_g1_i5.p1
MTQQLAALREKIEVEEGKRSSLEAGLSRSTANKQLERERLDKLLAAQQDSMWDSVARLHLVNQMKAAHHELEQYKARLMLECGACNSTRQKLHNDLQELRGNIRVFARIRPIMDKEKAKGEDQARLTVSSDGLSLTLTTRSKKSVTGMQEVSDRYKETKHINKSLVALGDVIQSLATKSDHVPFRNSKLTMLLKDSLGGNAKTLMFVNVSPLESNFPETLNSLRFASKVNNCTAMAKRNVGAR